MIEDFLEFRGGFGALVRSQIDPAAHIDGIQRSEGSKKAAGWRAHFLENVDLQQFARICSIAMVQCETRAERWQVTESDCRILKCPFNSSVIRTVAPISGRCAKPGAPDTSSPPHSPDTVRQRR
jgi:hypothetical protein